MATITDHMVDIIQTLVINLTIPSISHQFTKLFYHFDSQVNFDFIITSNMNNARPSFYELLLFMWFCITFVVEDNGLSNKGKEIL